MKFLEKDNFYRPMRMRHWHLGYRFFMPFRIAMLSAKKVLLKDITKGYGGEVIQAYICKSFKKQPKQYLNKAKQFKYFRGVLELCKELGLRVWIYDEVGYPSGGALGTVVKQMPEAETYGIICIKNELKADESVTVDLPHGHEKFKYAFFEDTEGITEITELADSKGSITYKAPSDGTLYYIASKVLYEGVHPTRKFGIPFRYIDVMDKAAVAKFLEITFTNYVKYVGDYLGDVVEAVFTDEPSVMNQYFSKLPYKPPFAIDTVDETIPLYKFIVWSRSFETEFKTRKGYDIVKNIPTLFKSNGDLPNKVKQDYYEVCRDLYKEAFFEQYKDFCEKNGLKLSGHLLGEELLQEHIINELDLFEMCKPMHYPGIDMLSCEPENLIKNPLTLKTVSSAAQLEGKKWVMSETSNHSDDKTKITKEKILCSLLIQYSRGINLITSYINDLYVKAADKKYVYDRISHAGQLLEKGSFYSELLVYYPVKSGYAFNTPSEKGHNERDYDPTFAKICNSFKLDAFCLDENKVTYTIANSRYLNDAALQNGRIVLGKSLPFKAIYIPYCFTEIEGIEQNVLRLAKSGAKIFVHKDTVLSPALKELDSLILVDSVNQIKERLYEVEHADVIFEEATSDVVYCRKISDDKDVYMFVNASAKATEIKVKIYSDKAPIGYDVITDTEFEPKLERQGEYQTISLTLPPYGAKFLIF